MNHSQFLSRKLQSLIAILNVVLCLHVSMFSTPKAVANVVGTATQNFNTTSSYHDYVTVHSSKTLGQGNFSLGLFLNDAVNSLPYFEGASSDDEEYESSSRSTYNDTIVGAELGMGFGILDRMDLGIAIPGVVYQDVDTRNETHGEFSKRGISEVRVGSKVNLYSNRFVGFALAGSSNINTTKEDPYSGSKPGPTYNAELISDVQIAAFSFAANVGYRWKNPGKKVAEDSPVEPTKNQVISSVAAAYSLPGSLNTQVIAEVFSSAPVDKEKDLSDRHTTTAESIVGLKIFRPNNLIYHVGGGTELRQSVSSADWRLYAGLNWQWSKPASIPKPQIVEAPPAAPVMQEKPDEIFVVHEILFEFDSDKIKGMEGYDYLAALAKSFEKRPIKRLIVEGHSCSVGGDKYNASLSEKRAARIRAILINNFGMSPSKVFAIGMGEKKPLASNKTDKGRELNRRVEFKIFYVDQDKNISAVKKDQKP